MKQQVELRIFKEGMLIEHYIWEEEVLPEKSSQVKLDAWKK